MFIKLITIVILTNIFIYFENFDLTNKLSLLNSNLYRYTFGFALAFILVIIVIYKQFENKIIKFVLENVISTVFNTAHVAIAFIFGLSLNIWIGDSSPNPEDVKLVFSFCLILWIFTIVASRALSKNLFKENKQPLKT